MNGFEEIRLPQVVLSSPQIPPGEEVLLGHLLAFFLLVAQPGRIALGNEGANLVAESEVLGREVEIHG